MYGFVWQKKKERIIADHGKKIHNWAFTIFVFAVGYLVCIDTSS
jgi:hypothetical protein